MLTDAKPREVSLASILPIRIGLAHIRHASASWNTTIWLSAVSLKSHSIPAPSSSARGKRDQAVFGNRGAIMQAPVREARRARVEGIRP